MRATSISELKQELTALKAPELTQLCLRLARFKKENKELLTYLLFEAHQEEHYIQQVKQEIDALFETVNRDHLYFAKKTLRKIVRIINKYARYSSIKQTDLELRIYFCQQLKASGIPFRQQAVISNLYDSQLKKIRATLATLHEDLQYDYRRMVEELAYEEPQGSGFSFFRRRKK